MVDPAIPHRRFQFRLRTLMIVVTLLALTCGYAGWQAKMARERHRAVATYRAVAGYAVEVDETPGAGHATTTRFPEAPWPLRWFGEDGYSEIIVPQRTTADEIERLASLFPEASIQRDPEN
jgi:hypothetical protein